MSPNTFSQIEDHMLFHMRDAAHDAEHVYRVLYNALEISEGEAGVAYDILLAACLLHDIGRAWQFENPRLCHAAEGGEMAYAFLSGIGFCEKDAEHVKRCIASHRYRRDCPPESIEAKILFDADKLDVTGAIGIARTLFYQGHVGTSLYAVDSCGDVLDGTSDDHPSFFHEYNFKLKHVYAGFYTRRGREIAHMRKQAMVAFYDRLLVEVRENRAKGKARLAEVLA